MPLVSVIVNIRNGSAYLREALDCVMSQTFTDWELIAWDDCSTDDSARIVAEYKDQRIRYFLAPQETPLGQARANAIRQATGQWLAFLDQDDLWTTTKLEKQMALADDSAGIIYGRTVLFWPGGRKRDYDQAHEFRPLPEGDIFSELFRSACFIAMSSAVLRRSAVAEAGGIPEWVEMTPDYSLYVAVARRYPARAVQEVVSWYRMHGSNMWRENRRKVYQEALVMIDQWADCLDPRIAAYRRRTNATGLALEEMRSAPNAGTGLKRLLREGSMAWLTSRPFVHVFRRIRRRVQRPLWQKDRPQVPRRQPSTLR
jgi:glycosyltransferase involved in cell wall biosynthesis